jgi:hypothetical protein
VIGSTPGSEVTRRGRDELVCTCSVIALPSYGGEQRRA